MNPPAGDRTSEMSQLEGASAALSAIEAAGPVPYNGDVPKRPKRLRRISHQDIAREAGVSRVTVSLVLAGKDQTSEETRKRVMEVAQRLRYRPNLLVQGMQTGRSHTVGV